MHMKRHALLFCTAIILSTGDSAPCTAVGQQEAIESFVAISASIELHCGQCNSTNGRRHVWTRQEVKYRRDPTYGYIDEYFSAPTPVKMEPNRVVQAGDDFPRLLIRDFSRADQGLYVCGESEENPTARYRLIAKLPNVPPLAVDANTSYRSEFFVWPFDDWKTTPSGSYRYRIVPASLTHSAVGKARCCNGVRMGRKECRITAPSIAYWKSLQDGRRAISACLYDFYSRQRGTWPEELLQRADLAADRTFLFRHCFEIQRHIFPQLRSLSANELYANPNPSDIDERYAAAQSVGMACNDPRTVALLHRYSTEHWPDTGDTAVWLVESACDTDTNCSSPPVKMPGRRQILRKFRRGTAAKFKRSDTVGEHVELICPSNSYETPVAWLNGSDIVRYSRRVFLDDAGVLHINPLEVTDAAIYSCWQNDDMTAAVALSVRRPRRQRPARFSVAIWYLNVGMAFNAAVFLALLLVYHQQRKYNRAVAGRTTDDEFDSLDDETSKEALLHGMMHVKR